MLARPQRRGIGLAESNLDQLSQMRFVWMCGVCGRRRTHSSAKSLRGNKKTRLQACARSLRNISIAIQHPSEVARSTLVNILHFEKMNAVRSRRMSTQDPGTRTAPKWEGLITALILVTNDCANPQSVETYNRWRNEMLSLRHEFQCREATSRCKAVREYLIEVDALLLDVQQRVSEMTKGMVPPPDINEVARTKRAVQEMRKANENSNPSPNRVVPQAYASAMYTKKYDYAAPPPARKQLLRPSYSSMAPGGPPPPPMGRAPLCPPPEGMTKASTHHALRNSAREMISPPPRHEPLHISLASEMKRINQHQNQQQQQQQGSSQHIRGIGGRASSWDDSDPKGGRRSPPGGAHKLSHQAGAKRRRSPPLPSSSDGGRDYLNAKDDTSFSPRKYVRSNSSIKPVPSALGARSFGSAWKDVKPMHARVGTNLRNDGGGGDRSSGRSNKPLSLSSSREQDRSYSPLYGLEAQPTEVKYSPPRSGGGGRGGYGRPFPPRATASSSGKRLQLMSPEERTYSGAAPSGRAPSRPEQQQHQERYPSSNERNRSAGYPAPPSQPAPADPAPSYKSSSMARMERMQSGSVPPAIAPLHRRMAPPIALPCRER